jgi:hypothetical protein
MNWTPIIDWLTLHGWKILFIVVIAAVLYFILRRLHSSYLQENYIGPNAWLP